MYTVVDLFAGAGGLSLGFQQTQKYDIKVAYENSPYMQETYRKNHPGVDVRDDVCKADYTEIQKKYGKIDIVIGGPPCQGFSNANRQKSHAVSQNNMLVKQYLRAITELQPKAFVMENVGMLRSEVHRFYLDRRDISVIKRYNVPTKETTLGLLDAKLMFEEIKCYIEDAALAESDYWPEDWYAKLNVVYKKAKNLAKMEKALDKHEKVLRKYAASDYDGGDDTPIRTASKAAFEGIMQYYDGVLAAEDIPAVIEPAVMYQRMLGKLKEIRDNDLVVERWDYSNGLSAIIHSYAVYDYLKAILEAEPNGYALNARVLCAADYGAPQKRMRFVMMGIKRSICADVKMPAESFTSENYRTVRDAISDLSDVAPVDSLEDDTGMTLEEPTEISELGQKLRDSSILRNHMVTRTTEVALERFRAIKQGQNFHSLDESLKTNTYTDVERTQNTIYLRLNYDEPSGTVINVRKSMWIHPEHDRAISVREAARLQTFPDSFVFYGSKDKQYQQVGNAVPPIMAEAIAKKLAQQLNKALADED